MAEWRQHAAATLMTAFMVGCIGETTQVDAQVDEVNEQTIDYQLWDAPTDIGLGEAVDGEVGYGECERVEPSDDSVDIEIHCGHAWAEVAWYRIAGEALLEPLSIGAHRLSVQLFSEDILRASIHRVADDGSTVKVATHPMLFDGDTISADIDEARDHYIYVARGRSIYPVWGTGSVSFSLVASAP